jgi:hypothetical protein
MTVDLAEFDKLRGEIDNRTTLGSNVVALELTAAGASIAVADKAPDALLGLAAVSCCLWLLWLDHAVQVYKVASYIGIQLAPRLAQSAGRPVLGWESYLRRLDAGGQRALEALYPNGAGPGVEVPQITGTRSVASYVTLLFGGIPVVTIAIYIAVVLNRFDSTALAIRFVAVALVAVLWVAAVIRFRQFGEGTKDINAALLAAGEARTGGENVRSQS